MPINVFKEIEDLEKQKKEKPSKKRKAKGRNAEKPNQQAAEKLVEDEYDEGERSDEDLEMQLELYPQEEISFTEAEPAGRSEIVEMIEDDVVEEASVASPPVAQFLDTIEETGEVDEEGIEEEEDESTEEEEVPQRPIRERRAPKALTYPKLGNPSYSEIS